MSDAAGRLFAEEDFFRSNLCRAWFKAFITHVLSRVNTVTGVAYKDEPAIFAWELINGAGGAVVVVSAQLARLRGFKKKNKK